MKNSQRKKIKKRKEWNKMRNVVKNNFPKLRPVARPRFELKDEDHDITKI